MPLKRFTTLLWPLAIGVMSLAATGWLWRHEQVTQAHSRRDNFDFSVRQSTLRIEERMASYEQMLRGVRGLFGASERVTHQDFSAYVDALTLGTNFAGLWTIGYAPLLLNGIASDPGATVGPPGGSKPFAGRAPIAFAEPAVDPRLHGLENDLLADPNYRGAMWLARDSGHLAMTRRLPAYPDSTPRERAGFLLFLPLYSQGRPLGNPAERRAAHVGWVFSGFRIGELMSSLYGEDSRNLVIAIHDGTQIDEQSLVYRSSSVTSGQPATYETQEYVSFGGHTWTLILRPSTEFEHRLQNNSAEIIAVSGTGLSLLLAALTWLLATGLDRAKALALTMTRQLSESTLRYRQIVETANEGIWVVDSNGRTSFVNPMMQRMMGCTAEDLLGRVWTDAMDATSRTALAAEAAGQARRGPAANVEVRFLRPDGQPLWATVATSPIQSDSSREAGTLAMVTDVTARHQAESERQQLELQLRQSQKMEAIGTLAGGIAHDFNNILAAILVNADLLREDLARGRPMTEALERIQRAGDRGRSLVQQIVAFARRQPQVQVVQALRPVIDEAAKLLRSTLPTRVTLELALCEEPLWVCADATQLQQVLLNLCTNAWHAMPGGSGRLRVGLGAAVLDTVAAERLGQVAAGAFAHLWVEDDGAGMDEPTRLRIFEPFFTTKPVGSGTGLGLSVVHGIVAAHGGAVGVASSPGRGSRFDLYFPRVTTPDAPPCAPGPVGSTRRGHGQHVLCVDDDPVMIVTAQVLLERAGFRVSIFSDPLAALARASAADDPVDVVVTDYNMPGCSGLDLARKLQGRRPGLQVIVSSGFVSETLHRDARAVGVRQVLQKEYMLEQLVELVFQALDSRVPSPSDAATPGRE